MHLIFLREACAKSYLFITTLIGYLWVSLEADRQNTNRLIPNPKYTRALYLRTSTGLRRRNCHR
jgi:hypothetical protein